MPKHGLLQAQGCWLPDRARDEAVLREALAVIARQLRDAGIDDDPMSYAPVRVIAERWARMPLAARSAMSPTLAAAARRVVFDLRRCQ